MSEQSPSSVYLAVDFGAGSGRVMASWVEDGTIQLEEVHRFGNDGVQLKGSWHWNVTQQFTNLTDGLSKAAETYGDRVTSIGIDTWGVDYGLVDQNGSLLGIPYQYRDGRTDDIMEPTFEKVSKMDIYNATGNQFMSLNTIFQLMAELKEHPERLQAADRILFMPDLFAYWLTGVMANEASIASTAQLVDARTGEWNQELIASLGLPEKLFQDITPAGTVLGTLLPSIAEATGLSEKVQVVAVGSHDTASAYSAVPITASEKQDMYLSSGTWSLLGIETPDAVISDTCFDLAFTNERATNGEIRLLKILCGMWLMQECKREWDEDGEVSWGALIEEAEAAVAFTAFIDPDSEAFGKPGGMPERIQKACEQTGQPVPSSRGAITRVILESLALKYAVTVGQLDDLVEKDLGNFHVVGGGCQNALLNQFTANAMGKTVIAGPVEATALGNIICQMAADNSLDSLDAGRELIKGSFTMETFEPEASEGWCRALGRFKEMIG